MKKRVKQNYWQPTGGVSARASDLFQDWPHGYNALIAFALVNVPLGTIPFLVMPALQH
ncbi:hypothetical protein OZ411_42860 [Bradyrhizobium sp. Arg237L]|uniref:hypothetical protein n=1 Tax=Bradyrhizobium sp. Arg237L TaxID=3003352 RepID=UPI00249DEF1E|nr:hypothetical protein [Bradyrhizobium sp. Arg237L]MDI4239526.1 hypothetical protein [Bradyrhizobium sp. Arg237L]